MKLKVFFSSGSAFKTDIFNIDDILEILFVVCTAVVCKVPSRQANLAILLFNGLNLKFLDVLQLSLIFGLTSKPVGNLRNKNLKVEFPTTKENTKRGYEIVFKIRFFKNVFIWSQVQNWLRIIMIQSTRLQKKNRF